MYEFKLYPKEIQGDWNGASNIKQSLSPSKIMDCSFTYQKVVSFAYKTLAISITILVCMCKSSEIITYLWGLNTSGVTSHFRHIVISFWTIHSREYSSYNLVIIKQSYSVFQQLYSIGGLLYGTFVNQIIKTYTSNKLKCYNYDKLHKIY